MPCRHAMAGCTLWLDSDPLQYMASTIPPISSSSFCSGHLPSAQLFTLSAHYSEGAMTRHTFLSHAHMWAKFVSTDIGCEFGRKSS
jgi:hypothetical protein